MDTEQQPETTYILGHSDQELERLISQAKLYEPFTMHFFRDAGITEGMRVLDVGCGTGDVSFLAARMVGPTGQVIGVDRAEIAVETANRRAADLQVTNVRFVVGDIGEMAFPEPFDAVVGRFVLQWCPDPIAVLRHLKRYLRPGGVVVFQEYDLSGYPEASYPPSPLWEQTRRLCIEPFQRAGGNVKMGMQLYGAFLQAELPAPQLRFEAAIGGGPDWPGYEWWAETVRVFLPLIEQFGIATEEEIGIDTLADRLREEAASMRGIARTPIMVSAWVPGK